MSDRQGCAKRVFSGARWDFGGHMCSRVGRYQDPTDGKWYCKTHLPANVKARDDERKAAYQQARNVEEQLKADAKARAERLSRKLGVTIEALPQYSRHTFGVTGHLYVIADVMKVDES